MNLSNQSFFLILLIDLLKQGGDEKESVDKANAIKYLEEANAKREEFIKNTLESLKDGVTKENMA